MVSQGKVALVSGGAVGIGKAIALGFANAGIDVAITYKNHDGQEVRQTIEGLGRRSIALRAEATDPESVDWAVKQAVQHLGALDYVVANAGGLIKRVPLATMSTDHWRQVIDTNLTSAFLLARSSNSYLRAGGRVVFVSSLAAYTGGSNGAGAYAAAKAGLFGLTHALAKELAPRGISVNAVAPGFIAGTPFHDQFTAPADQAAIVQRLPLGRAGSPEDVASLVVCLASGMTDFLTGQVITLSGGQELT